MIRIAAFDSTDDDKKKADLVCAGRSDQKTIQDAVQKAGIIELLTGRFVFDDKLRINNSVKLTGQGRDGSTIHRASTHKGHLISVGETGGVEICNLSFNDGGDFLDPGEDTGGTDTVLAWSSSDIHFHDLHASKVYRTGILAAGCSNVLIERCVVEGGRGTSMDKGGDGGVGIEAFSYTYIDPSSSPAKNCIIRDCEVSGCWRVGIWATGVEDLEISHCHVHDNMPQEAVDAGIEAGGQIGVGSGCSNVIVADNLVHGGVKTIGIEFDITNFGTPHGKPTQNGLITRNRIRDQGLCGILLVSDSQSGPLSCFLSIEGNTISNTGLLNLPGYASILVNPNLMNFRISGNMVNETKNIACHIRSGAQNYTVSGNHFRGEVIYEDSAVSNRVISNNLDVRPS